MTSRALIGHTGFVGGNLLRQAGFEAMYRSTNIGDIRGREFDLLVISAVQAKKWWANQEPEADWAGIQKLLEALAEVQAREVVLISTIDVLPTEPGLDESFDPHGVPNHPYGTHRLRVEDWVRERFPAVTVVRLPGLFGPGLKKNVLYDLLHGNQLEKINPSSSFQYYDLSGLWADIQVAREASLPLIHLFTEPVRTQRIIDAYFPEAEVGSDPLPEAHYDFRTCYADLYGGPPGYIQSAEVVLERMGTFMAAERRWEET